MFKKRDDIDWPPEADEIPLLDIYGEPVTPERMTFRQYIRWFFFG
ncbi:hypothetical protein VSS74_03295 [Conexibacter stalactiti]|uniref:Uncharacterized protein n=1 Tax=Conexibacter stalactiti TaxID=1940611 RepID=A0ABU4HJ57_9ACTN|nr:hypothetical protein [Conexibacter stalactiti]MDW5593346.1 hypothetical protein [Conexibacter stalactiti]MEC5033987.1 hypothetical protein [Conexibacter stalactiti]